MICQTCNLPLHELSIGIVARKISSMKLTEPEEDQGYRVPVSKIPVDVNVVDI
jgi:predicted RNA-binding protein with PUA domain